VNAARILRAGGSYFALVFGAGFLLGAIRVPLLVPRLGERVAELLEMPVMLAVIVASAGFVVRRFALPPARSVRLAVGLLALGLMLGAETLLVLVVQQRPLAEYIVARDPVSGGAYGLMLVLLALLPLRRARPAGG
jgi:hypothetical protein